MAAPAAPAARATPATAEDEGMHTHAFLSITMPACKKIRSHLTQWLGCLMVSCYRALLLCLVKPVDWSLCVLTGII
jgi:hypothetical protein